MIIKNRFQEMLDEGIQSGTLGHSPRQYLRAQANAFYEGAASSHKELQLLKEQLKATQKELNRIKRDLIQFEKDWMLAVLKEGNNVETK